MAHLIVIVVFVAMFLRDGLGASPLLEDPVWAWAVALGGPLLVALVAGWRLRARQRWLERTGEVREFERAERVVRWSLFGGAAIHSVAVLALGWLDLVRSGVGDLVIVDELLAGLPTLLLMPVLWWLHSPIETILREAVLIRRLDEGRGAVYPVVSRGCYVGLNVRHQLGLVLVPLAGVLAWGEAVDRVAGLLARRAPSHGDPAHGLVQLVGAWLIDPGIGVWLVALAQLGGAILVFATVPLALRRIWDTVPLAPGPLRERLDEVCAAHGVRIRELLVWRTHGTMINGAVMGLMGRARYILLTDALLDLLPLEHVEAVTAHEVGHVRRRHLAWLAVAIMAAAMGTALVVSVLAQWAWAGEAPREVLGIAALAPAALSAVLAFGYVSRRFEWQADAFAAAHLSRSGAGGGAVMDPGGVGAMGEALRNVADAAGVPRDRRSWRHGSIAQREARLLGLVGRPVDDLPIDREVGVLKLVSGVMLAVALAGLLLGGFA